MSLPPISVRGNVDGKADAAVLISPVKRRMSRQKDRLILTDSFADSQALPGRWQGEKVLPRHRKMLYKKSL